MASDPYEGIDINLDSSVIDEDRQPLPSVPTNFVIASVERKRKEGADWPYVAMVLHPVSDDPKIARRKCYFNITFHPQMLWQMRDFRKACGMALNVSAKALLENPNSDQDYVGRKFSTSPKVVASQNDPDRKVNQIDGPFRPAF